MSKSLQGCYQAATFHIYCEGSCAGHIRGHLVTRRAILGRDGQGGTSRHEQTRSYLARVIDSYAVPNIFKDTHGAGRLNLAERFFAEITRKRIRRGVFTSVAELDAIVDYLHQHNIAPKPFVWTKTAKVIFDKEPRALGKLEAIKKGYQASDLEH